MIAPVLSLYWTCDFCMRRVQRHEIADMCDGEHVICIECYLLAQSTGEFK